MLEYQNGQKPVDFLIKRTTDSGRQSGKALVTAA
jgi:hypothetical protein